MVMRFCWAINKKSVPELQQEPLQLPEDGHLQVPLAVGVREPPESPGVGAPGRPGRESCGPPL